MAEKPRILLVDDEPAIIKVVSKRLEAEGFEVLTAMGGLQALAAAKGEAPDLIVLDLMLPEMNGYEVCTILKQDDRYRKIPIVLFTAKTQERDEKLGHDCGADAYIRKPFQAAELVGTIRRFLAAPGVPAKEVA